MSLWRWGFPSSQEKAAHVIGWRGLHPTGACSLPAGRAQLSASPGTASLGSEAVRAIRARWITEASLRRVQRSELCWSSRSLLRGNAHPRNACGPPPLQNGGVRGSPLPAPHCQVQQAGFGKRASFFPLCRPLRSASGLLLVRVPATLFTIRGVRTGKSPTLPNHCRGK